MGLTAVEQANFGGVDSRSNPLSMPQDRAIKSLNFSPQRDGHLQLRRGYEKVSMSEVTNAPIHSIVSMRKIGGAEKTVFFQGTVPKVRSIGGAIATPPVKGTPINSDAHFSYTFANGMLYAFSETDEKVFDGTCWRDPGLPALYPVNVADVVVSIGAPNDAAILASSVGTPQAGYKFYACIYNRVTGDVGNRIAIGDRVVPTVNSEIGITGLPVFDDDELDILIGRTADGAEVPYACMDTDGNWLYAPHGQTSITVSVQDIDGGAELPVRNTQPQNIKQICRTGDRMYGRQHESPYVRYSESDSDAARDGSFLFVGRWANAWPDNNVETFPTGENTTNIKSYNNETWVWSWEHVAILSELSGTPGWQGPWIGGCPSRRGYAETPRGPVWFTSEKQLASMTQNGPVSISDEYERSELKRIGDAYLSEVEVVPFRDQEKGIDIIIVKGRDKDGNPLQVIHDANLVDERSQTGQGYTHIFSGRLANDYTIASVQDDNGRQQVWAGSQDGQLCQLYTGANDDGVEYDAEMILLVNAGPERPSAKFLEWYGDGNLEVSVAQKLDSLMQDFIDLTGTRELVQGGEHDSQYRVDLNVPKVTTELKHVYVRLKLRSHSEEGNLELNDPPHIPLETYGRIYQVAPLLGSERGH